MSGSFPMVPVPQALEIVLQQCTANETASIPLAKAHGCILAADVVATQPFPPFRASIMDGYAVRAADGPGIYPVVAEVTAGLDPNFTLAPGTIAYITTGAPVPEGADAVIMVERTVKEPTDKFKPHSAVKLLDQVTAGDSIRPVGSDITVGEVVLPKGTLLRAAELGLLASVGCVAVPVHRQPVIAVLSTGDELVPPTETPQPGKIRDSNKSMLMGAIIEAGGIALDAGCARDEEGTLREHFTKAVHDADVVIMSGGVSMGDLDLIKPLLASTGTIHFGRLNMKPGKPTTFATVTDGKNGGGKNNNKRLVFGLPGNPVSALVTFYLLAMPAIRVLRGYTPQQAKLPSVQAVLAQDVKADSVRPEYHRVGLCWENGKFLAYSTGNQISSRLLSLRSANALMYIEAGLGTVPAGTTCEALLIGALGEGEQVKQNRAIMSNRPVNNQARCMCEKADVQPQPHQHQHQHQHQQTSSSSSSSSSSSLFELRVAILTVSDRCSQGLMTDKSGPACVNFMTDLSKMPEGVRVSVFETALVPDETQKIASKVREWCDGTPHPHLILTTGGTGFSPRDVTPEAVRSVLMREAPGLVFAMLKQSLEHTPMAVLSRPVAGTRKSTLILTLPGSPKAVSEILTGLWSNGSLLHAIKLLQDEKDNHPQPQAENPSKRPKM